MCIRDSSGGWTQSRARKRGVSQCKFPIVTKVHENMLVGGSNFVCLLTSLKDNDTVRYPVRPLYWMGVKSSKLISTFDTFLLVLDELQLSATDSTFCTKNAADPIANEGTSRDEYCGWSISASINMQHTQKRSNIDYPIAHHTTESGMLECLLEYIPVMWQWRHVQPPLHCMELHVASNNSASAAGRRQLAACASPHGQTSLWHEQTFKLGRYFCAWYRWTTTSVCPAVVCNVLATSAIKAPSACAKKKHQNMALKAFYSVFSDHKRWLMSN